MANEDRHKENLYKAKVELVKTILEKNLGRGEIENLKLKFAKENNCKIPLNSELLEILEKENFDEECKEKFKELLKTKPTRTLSGIVTIAIMAPLMSCPGQCIYCPTVKGVPKSYTGAEPSTMRAALCNWDPEKIIKARLKQLQAIGHTTDKCEVIVQGGTWSAASKEWRTEYTKKIFDAFNGFSSENLEAAQTSNESAEHRVIGLTFETRPDFCSEEEVDFMLNLGATRVELGLQSVYDDVLTKIKRGHGLKEAINAIRILKNKGLKVDLHVMLGLPGSNKEKDIEMFRILFENPDLRPDGLKIYPTAVLPGTELYEMWAKGEYRAIGDDYIIDVLTQAKAKYIPKYCRIKRIMRDIPTTKILDGYKYTNLRDIIRKKLDQAGLKCNCIRCREIGQKYKYYGILPKTIELKTLRYEASGGKEYFISFEDPNLDILLGFIRLRLCQAAFVRELHVYGEALPIEAEKPNSALAIQHSSLGKKLLAEAERIAKSAGYDKLFVTSGIGVRQYYAKQGYHLERPYMVKLLK